MPWKKFVEEICRQNYSPSYAFQLDAKLFNKVFETYSQVSLLLYKQIDWQTTEVWKKYAVKSYFEGWLTI